MISTFKAKTGLNKASKRPTPRPTPLGRINTNSFNVLAYTVQASNLLYSIIYYNSYIVVQYRALYCTTGYGVLGVYRAGPLDVGRISAKRFKLQVVTTSVRPKRRPWSDVGRLNYFRFGRFSKVVLRVFGAFKKVGFWASGGDAWPNSSILFGGVLAVNNG